MEAYTSKVVITDLGSEIPLRYKIEIYSLLEKELVALIQTSDLKYLVNYPNPMTYESIDRYSKVSREGEMTYIWERV